MSTKRSIKKTARKSGVKRKAAKKAAKITITTTNSGQHTRIVHSLKNVVVDEKIIPVLDWLNSYQSVNTNWCCQGGPATTNVHEEPYVIFTCLFEEDLHKILKTLEIIGEDLAYLKIQWNAVSLGHVRYMLTFTHEDSLQHFNMAIESMHDLLYAF